MPSTQLLRLPVREMSATHFDFLSVLGSLLHFSKFVRLDIAVAVKILASHAAAPGVQHVQAQARPHVFV